MTLHSRVTEGGSGSLINASSQGAALLAWPKSAIWRPVPNLDSFCPSLSSRSQRKTWAELSPPLLRHSEGPAPAWNAPPLEGTGPGASPVELPPFLPLGMKASWVEICLLLPQGSAPPRGAREEPALPHGNLPASSSVFLPSRRWTLLLLPHTLTGSLLQSTGPKSRLLTRPPLPWSRKTPRVPASRPGSQPRARARERARHKPARGRSSAGLRGGWAVPS